MARVADPALRKNLLMAARSLFAEKDYADTRMSDIAQRAGVAVGTIYLYFKTKEQLVSALCADSNRRVMSVVLPALQHPDLRQAIDSAVRVAFDAYAQEHDLLRLIYLNIGLGNLAEIDVSAIDNDSVSEFTALLRDCMDVGIVRRYDDFDTLLELLFNLFDMAALQCFVLNDGKTIDLETQKKTLSQFVQGALLVDSPPQKEQ